jgi:SRSO17 transposase
VKARQIAKLERELGQYLEGFIAGLGRPERREALRLYMTGLLLDGDRKSMEPMAGRLVDDESEIEAMRQRLQQAVTIAAWSDSEVLARLSKKLDAELPGVEALVIDDTGFPKKGKHSVGVQRQYSGTLGRVDNCQVAVSLHLAGEQGSGMIGFRLFLPESWATDRKRRKDVGVPSDVVAATKSELALAHLDAALAAGIRRHVVLADAGYGDSREFRDALDQRGLHYVVAVNGEPVVWPPGSAPRRTREPSGSKGELQTKYVDENHPAIVLKELAPALRFKQVSWREGSKGWQSGHFAAIRVRTAHGHASGRPPGDEQWLLCQSTGDPKTPYKFWLSNLPLNTTAAALVRFAKLRWRVERDYQELKQELGLDHFEGRTWRGFHHHATLCAVAHGFLALRRALFPPEDPSLDTSDGPQSDAADPPAAHRLLPALPKARPRSGSSARRLENVIKSY